MVYVYSTPGVRLVNVTVCWRVDEGKVVVVGPSCGGEREEMMSSSLGECEVRGRTRVMV